MAKMSKEDPLNLAFATKLAESSDFSSWVLGQTKFAKYAGRVRLLDREQALARQAKFWWGDWWCKVPELGKESQTDILAAFEISGTKQRFALHIENKLRNSKFQPNQAESYPVRARYMLNNKKSALLYCSDFDTVLIAPRSFRDSYRKECDLFGCYIAHEDIANFVSDFGD